MLLTACPAWEIRSQPKCKTLHQYFSISSRDTENDFTGVDLECKFSPALLSVAGTTAGKQALSIYTI